MDDRLIPFSQLVDIRPEIVYEHLDYFTFATGCGKMDRFAPDVLVFVVDDITHPELITPKALINEVQYPNGPLVTH